LLSTKRAVRVGTKTCWLPFVGDYRTFLGNPVVDHAGLFATVAALLTPDHLQKRPARAISPDSNVGRGLIEAEASFRALKSELSVRPLFHQLEPRVKPHVMVAFLGYALWVTLKHLLKHRPMIAAKPSASGVDNVHPLSPMRAIASAFHPAKRRHRSSHYRRSRNPSAQHHRADGGAEIPAPATRNQPAKTSSVQSRM
jgi:hypothetical protein